MGKPLTISRTFPFQGGIDEVHGKPNLKAVSLINGKVPVGLYQAQNVRPLRPEFDQRGGMAKQHTTTNHSTKEITSMFSFSKGRTDEISFFTQLDDGSVEKASNNPPAVTTGDFGASVLAARAGASPGAFAEFKDYLLYGDGAGRPQIYTGVDAKIYAFNVYKGTTTIPNIPEEGADYTQEVTDDLTTTFADIGSLDRLADDHCLFVITDIPVDKLSLAFSAWNSTEVGDLAVKYWNGTAYTAVSGLVDGTQGDGAGSAGTIEFGKDGDLTWTSPTDELPYFAFGRSGFIYQISHSHATNTLDATVELASLTCEHTGGFQDLQNVWDGVMIDAVEARLYTNANSTYSIYSGQAIRPGGATSSDKIYFNSQDPLFGIYLDVGATPNVNATTISGLEVWDGEAWTSVGGSLNDGTSGGKKSGYLTWNRSVTPKKLNFNGSQYHSYWYRFSFNDTLSASLTWAVQTMPYFNMDDIYPVAENIAAWDRRVWIGFNDNYLYGSAQFNPTGFNGADTALVPIGDHRSNKIKCLRKFYNFLLVWLEEKGGAGGSFNMVQPGATASGYAAQIISPNTGILNSKCAVVLEGVTMSDLNNERPVMTGAYFVSRGGVYKSDGSFLINISGGIGNYFDPEKDECIRKGYEGKHFLGFDSANSVILLGIVSGSTAEVPNKFFVFDPLTNEWTEDVWGYDISCVAEAGAASGNIPVLQLAGCQDGFVRRINTGNQDDGIDIVSNIVLSIDGEGRKLSWEEEAFTCKAQASGEIVRSVATDGSEVFGYEKKLSMVSKPSGDTYRKHRHPAGNVVGDHLLIKYENSTSNVSARYINVGMTIDEIDNNAV